MTLARRRLLRFFVAILVLHGGALVLYRLLGIGTAPRVVQERFAWGWMALTVLVVFVGLQRVNRARRGRG